ncbi:MAG: electron transfer flavoprotein subunit beta/FixA family protein [Planctomycetota bacterium]|nr:electron transfer flavoprotein subunit beta/FixA family protein [Planctomycetota bacterium]MDI6787542.1 electron transfer flavoprotein subunit beta/FixA family protein [Planctomycetota bacterium]
MNIIVCVKRVPSTETTVRVASDGKSLEQSGVEYILSPFDEIALEEGLRIKERLGSGEVSVISVGPPETATTLRTCLAIGADKAIHIKDSDVYKRDPFSIASALASVIKTLPYSLVLCGKQAVDDDNAQVPAMLARLLNIPYVSVVTKVEISGTKAMVNREVSGGYEILEVDLPAVLTAQKGLNEPRYPSLKGIMSAKKKPLEEKTVTFDELSLETIKMEYPPSRQAGRIVGKGVEAVPELVKLLKEEAKII